MAVVPALSEIVGAPHVLTDEAETAPFRHDWRGRYGGPAVCVVLPGTVDEVSRVVQACRAAGVPVLPQGGNTSLCGGATPLPSDRPPVIVSLRRLRRIRHLDAVANTMVVDAGCVLQEVQEAAAAQGRLYPVSLGAEGSCQIGGTIATNAGGTGVLRYGNTRENVLGLEVVLPDGTVWDGLNALRKNNTGYDLKHLFVGSEGTLGIVTGAVLRLHPLPTARSIAWLSVPDPAAALKVLALVQASCGSRLSAFELMNAHQAALVVKHVPGRRLPVEGGTWFVLLELSDTGDATALEGALQGILEEAFAAGLVVDAAVAASEAQRAALWEFRHSVSEANKKDGIGLSSDTAVPVSAVPDFIAAATAAVRAIVPDMPVAVVAHMGDGNVHFIPFFGFGEWDALPDREAAAQSVRQAIDDAAVSRGGTFSAEHGVGLTRLPDMARYKPAAELALMHAVKRTLDPDNLFNPGRLLPPAPASATPPRRDEPPPASGPHPERLT